MKLIVMSDSHGNLHAVQKLFTLHEDADLFIHLGDGEREVNALLQRMPQIQEKLHYLKGNCDSGLLIFQTMNQLTLTLPYGHRVFAAHGDYYQVKFGTARMAHEAAANHCDLMLYGHSHAADCRYENGIHIINPGSVSCPRDGGAPSYALIDISESGILPNIVRMP